MCGIAEVLGSVVSAMLGGSSSGGSTTVAQPTTTLNTGTTAADAAEAARKKAAQMSGYQTTIATGGLGDTSQANTEKKTLLGQ